MENAPRPTSFRERLIPSLGLFIALFMIVPAVALVVIAIDTALAVPIGLLVYAVVMGLLVLTSPVVSVERGTLAAGRARIPVSQLGEIDLLGREALKYRLGTGGDARDHLVIRGWIHTGVRIEITDPADPTPHWIITTRRPEALARAIDAQRGAVLAG